MFSLLDFLYNSKNRCSLLIFVIIYINNVIIILQSNLHMTACIIIKIQVISCHSCFKLTNACTVQLNRMNFITVIISISIFVPCSFSKALQSLGLDTCVDKLQLLCDLQCTPLPGVLF
jgi:hypothetical protein